MSGENNSCIQGKQQLHPRKTITASGKRQQDPRKACPKVLQILYKAFKKNIKDDFSPEIEEYEKE